MKDRVRLRNICAASVFVCLLGRICCVLFLPRTLLVADFLARFTPLRVDALLLGGFVALCLRGPEARSLKRLAMPVIYSVGAVFLAMEVYYLATSRHFYHVDGMTPWLGTVGFTLIDLLSAAIILRTIEPTSTLFRLLGNRWLRRLGQISYGFYVFHDIPHIFYYKLLQHYFRGSAFANSSLMVAAIALVTTIVLAYFSYRFFETPFLKLKSRFVSDVEGNDVPLAADR